VVEGDCADWTAGVGEKMIKAKDLYRGHKIDEDLQRAVLRGEPTTLHRQVVAQILEIGIVLPRGLDRPKRCRCGGLIVAAPCVRCQLEELAEVPK